MSFKINFNSIITRISTIFVITIALFTMNFIGYFKYQQDTVKQSIANKYKDELKKLKKVLKIKKREMNAWYPWNN